MKLKSKIFLIAGLLGAILYFIGLIGFSVMINKDPYSTLVYVYFIIFGVGFIPVVISLLYFIITRFKNNKRKEE